MTQMYNDINNESMIESDKIDICNRLSDDILLMNLKSQINSIKLHEISQSNILNIFDERYSYILNKFNRTAQDDDLISRLKDIKNKIYDSTLDLLSDRFGLQLDMLDGIKYTEDYYFYIKYLYEFFILNYNKNLISFMSDYLIKNASSFEKIENFSIIDKKNLVMKSIKQITSNNSFIILLYYLPEICNYVANNFEGSKVILKNVISLDEYAVTSQVVKYLFLSTGETNTITEKFTEQFFSPFGKDNYNTITSSIRSNLIKYITTDEAKPD